MEFIKDGETYIPSMREAQYLFNLTDKPRYVFNKHLERMTFDHREGSYLTSTWVINKTSDDVLIYPALSRRTNEPWDIIPSLFKESAMVKQAYHEERIIIKCFNHSGMYDTLYSHGFISNTLPEVEVYEYTVTKKELLKGPVYVRGINMVFGLFEHKAILTDYMPNSTESKRKAMEDAFVTWYEEHPGASIVIEANDPTGKCVKLYTVINGHLSAVCFKSNSDFESSAYIRLRSEDGNESFTITFDPQKVFKEGCDSQVLDKSFWCLGNDRRKLIKAYYDYSESFIQRDEHESTVNDLEDMHKREIETLKRAITIKDAEIKNLKKYKESKIGTMNELAEREEFANKSYIETMKLEMEKIKAENDKLKYGFDRSNLHIERDISDLKLKKEQQSTASSELGLIATAVKTAAVVIPVAAALYVALKPAAVAIGVAYGAVSLVGSVCSACSSLFSWLF